MIIIILYNDGRPFSNNLSQHSFFRNLSSTKYQVQLLSVKVNNYFPAVFEGCCVISHIRHRDRRLGEVQELKEGITSLKRKFDNQKTELSNIRAKLRKVVYDLREGDDDLSPLYVGVERTTQMILYLLAFSINTLLGMEKIEIR